MFTPSCKMGSLYGVVSSNTTVCAMSYTEGAFFIKEMRNYFFYPQMQCPPNSPELGASPHSPVPESQPPMCSSPAQMSSTSSSRKNCAQKPEEDISKDMSTYEENELLVSFGDLSKPIGNDGKALTRKRKLTAPSSTPAKRPQRRLSMERNPVQAVETISRFARMQFSPESAKTICSTITRKLLQSTLDSSPASAATLSRRARCSQCQNSFRAVGGNTICFPCWMENQIDEKSTGDGSQTETQESLILRSTISQLKHSLLRMENIQTSITPTEASELSFWIGHANVSINSLMDCLSRLRMATSSPLNMKRQPSDSECPMSSSSPISRPKNPVCQQIDGTSSRFSPEKF